MNFAMKYLQSAMIGTLAIVKIIIRFLRLSTEISPDSGPGNLIWMSILWYTLLIVCDAAQVSLVAYSIQYYEHSFIICVCVSILENNISSYPETVYLKVSIILWEGNFFSGKIFVYF